MTTTFAFAIEKPVSLPFTHWLSNLFAPAQPAAVADDSRVDNIRALQRMARDLETSQPNLAAELRYFASKS